MFLKKRGGFVMKQKALVLAIVLVSITILLFVHTPVCAQSLETIPVPMVSTNPAIPHDTYNGVATIFKAIARGGSGTYNYEWDFNGDGIYDYSNVTTDRYNLSATHTYPDQSSDKTYVARIRVTSGAETAIAEYRVTVHATAMLWVKVNKAIDDGLWYLHINQMRGTDANSAEYGYWNYYYPVAATGAATEAFEIQGHLPEGNYDTNPYVETVQRGLNYLLSQTYVYDIFPQTAGDPDTNGNGLGLACSSNIWDFMYENGTSLMAFASSKAPNRIAQTGSANVIGRTYKDIVQDMIDYVAFAQNDPETGGYRGGWRYYPNYGNSDNSVSQWPVIGMEAAETNMGAAGVVVPQFVKDELNVWIDYIQDDASGGSGYTSPFEWVNIAKTGGLLCEMKFYGDNASVARAINAINYIDVNWDTDPEHFPYDSYYAFYSVMKGFRLLGVKTLPSGLNWYEDPTRGYANHLVNTQYADGHWVDGYFVTDSYLASAWAVLILQPHPTEIMPTAIAKASPKEAPPGAVITFDHSGSYHSDPDRTLVAFRWDLDNDGGWDYETSDINSKPTYVYNDSIGCGDEVIHPVTLEVEDDAGKTAQDDESVIIKINLFNHPPVAIGDPTPSDPNYIVGQGGKVLLDASDSYDSDTAAPVKCDTVAPDDHIVKWEWDLNNDGVYEAEGETHLFDTPDDWAIGSTHTVQLRVTDDGSWAGPDGGGSKSSETTVTIFVADNTPPDCSKATPSIAEIWSPNHKMVNIEVVGVTDPDNDPLTIAISGITQDEPVKGKGDGNTAPDGAGVGARIAQVRAERSGNNNSRVYQISFIASDGQGGECSGIVQVCVPHDQRPGHECIDDGQNYDSTTQ
jgi:hypothetical protein